MAKMPTVNEPTGDECSTHAVVYEDEYIIGRAIWYPQMGGYAGSAIVFFSKHNKGDCVDVYVWHDGEFPFDGEGPDGPRYPVLLHHCVPEQFVDFGKKIVEFNGSSDDNE